MAYTDLRSKEMKNKEGKFLKRLTLGGMNRYLTRPQKCH